MRYGERNACLREKLILAGLKGGASGVRRAVSLVGADRNAACMTLALAVVIRAVVHVANNALDDFCAATAALVLLHLFFQVHFLFSADFCLQVYFA